MSFWFPDTTVVRNFACIRQLHLLTLALRGRGRCAEAMHGELQDAATIKGHEQILAFLRDEVLGEPVEVEDEDHIKMIQRIRVAEVGGDPDDPLDSLGEAETLFLLDNVDDFSESIWLTDDVAAHDFGCRRGLRTVTTFDVMAIAVAEGLVSLEEGFMYLGLMGARGRVLAFAPTSRTEFSQRVDTWSHQVSYL